MADLKIPTDLKYTKNDEWLRIDGDSATMGISDYAQDQFNDVVYVEFPDVGATLLKEHLLAWLTEEGSIRYFCRWAARLPKSTRH
ncbi:MAG: hypothetical protein R3E39_27610 [Anaerolineae bacterium]